MKRGKDNIVGVGFINYGELHDNYQHSQDYKFRRTVDLFQRETFSKRWFPTLTLEQSRVQNKNLEMLRSFSGNETSESGLTKLLENLSVVNRMKGFGKCWQT